jgi:[ribosomal protein S5]-alanine N-acetyltransferase
MNAPIVLTTERFLLRQLSVNDVTETYLGWLDDAETKKWISSASTTEKLMELKKYVLHRVAREDICFLGIFDRKNQLHIGNIKYEPVNAELGYAIMGILIGNVNYRGKGVFEEVFKASASWLKEHRNISEILLGVQNKNISAVHAYRKVGFKETQSPFINNSFDGITLFIEL